MSNLNGMEYPRNQMEFERVFASEQDCLKYLIEVKWPNGFCCNNCGSKDYWLLSRKRVKCKNCSAEITVTADTFFSQSNKPLSMWFRAIWWMIAQKSGISASGLQAILGLGSYKTAWVWLHKLRSLMVFPNREKLSGKIEIDETLIGGPAEGKRGRGADNKTLVLIAVEILPKGTGRIRVETSPDASGYSIMQFIRKNVELGSTIVSDGWTGYSFVSSSGYNHVMKKSRKSLQEGEELLPNVHRAAALTKRWLLGTHQNYASPERLQKYLDEFTFRYNRRKSKSRGLLFHRVIEQAVIRAPVLSRKILDNSQ